MKKVILQLLLCICLGLTLTAQVKTDFNNQSLISESGRFAKNYAANVLDLPPLDIKKLLDEEKADIQNSPEIKPFRIAKPVPVDIDVVQRATWTTDGQFTFGKLTIRAKGAQSISANFDRFSLPAGTELFVYNEQGNMITGPVTEKENNKSMSWGSWVYKGSYLTIEVRTPLQTKKDLQLHLSNIAYGYKQVYQTKVDDFGASGACNINVLCPQGNGWQAERESVALILAGDGSALCSGAMITNTGNTCYSPVPYLLTANHCFVANSTVANWRFTFLAWSPTCTPSQNNNGVTFNGSTLRANWATTDFCLVELNQSPGNSNIKYAGWNRSATAASNATGIHHPHGDVMKIAKANSAVSRGSFDGTTNQHWQATWNAGVTEPGSSGSPLFDQNHRIVGQLHGGPSGCGNPNQWDFYGSFDLSWTGGGTNATRLSNWLDPLNTGVTTTNTDNFYPPTATYNLYISPEGSPSGCFDLFSIYTATAFPQYGSEFGLLYYQWELRPTSSPTPAILPYTGPEAQVVFESPGQYEISVTPVGTCGLGQRSSTYVTANFFCPGGGGFRVAINPNPVKGILNVNLSSTDKAATAKGQKIQVTIVDKFGMQHYTSSQPADIKQLRIPVYHLKTGNYYLIINNGKEKIAKPFVITN